MVCKNKEGKPGDLHYGSDVHGGFYMASFGTDWKDYIRDVIL